MSQVFVQTEEVYRKRGFFDETERHFITADELVDVLNSAKEDGPDRFYVLAEEKPARRLSRVEHGCF